MNKTELHTRINEAVSAFWETKRTCARNLFSKDIIQQPRKKTARAQQAGVQLSFGF